MRFTLHNLKLRSYNNHVTITIPREPLGILYILQKAGYEAYIVGGAVRDIMRASLLESDQKITDFDFTTNATPEQIQALFPENFYENTFGTVSVTPKHLREQIQLPEPSITSAAPQGEPAQRVIDIAKASKIHISLLAQTEALAAQNVPSTQEEAYEITTFRSDGVYTDHRRPETVSWGTSLDEDLNRRDFTINAIAIAITQEKLQSLFSEQTPPETVNFAENEYQLLDPHQGIVDLKEHTVRTVGDPHARFSEDALRMLRAIRFSVQLNMRIADETYLAIRAQSALLAHISQERIRDEFCKMLMSDFPREAIELLDDTDLLRHILPELLSSKGVQQGGHHTTDVWTHSLDALAETPSSDVVVRLATLLHDIAKPQTYQVINGQPTFYNHEIIGSRMAKKIAQRLRFSNNDCERIFTLVRFHMFHYQPEQTDAAIRRFMRNVGLENIDDILDLREGDRLGSGARKTSWRLEEMKQRMIEQLNQPLSVTDLAIDGTELMKELQLQPGPLIGKLLKHLFELVMEQPELNTKEELLARSRQALEHQELLQSAPKTAEAEIRD